MLARMPFWGAGRGPVSPCQFSRSVQGRPLQATSLRRGCPGRKLKFGFIFFKSLILQMWERNRRSRLHEPAQLHEESVQVNGGEGRKLRRMKMPVDRLFGGKCRGGRESRGSPFFFFESRDCKGRGRGFSAVWGGSFGKRQDFKRRTGVFVLGFWSLFPLEGL